MCERTDIDRQGVYRNGSLTPRWHCQKAILRPVAFRGSHQRDTALSGSVRLTAGFCGLRQQLESSTRLSNDLSSRSHKCIESLKHHLETVEGCIDCWRVCIQHGRVLQEPTCCAKVVELVYCCGHQLK